ncbi:MAG: hypothetical protein AAF702_43290 [Chloroflexota bacterium]
MTTSNPLDTTIKVAQKEFSRLFQSTDQSFDDTVWNLSHLLNRTPNKTINLDFSSFQQSHIPPSVSQIVKCWILLTRTRSPKRSQARLLQLKRLYTSITKGSITHQQAFGWSHLNDQHLVNAEISMNDTSFVHDTKYQQACISRAFAKFLESRHICGPIDYQPIIKERRINETIQSMQKQRDANLPSEEAIRALGTLYRELCTEPDERLIVASLAIMLMTGLRFTELLTLPENCEINNSEQYGIRFFKGKSRKDQKRLSTRWLSPLQAKLVRTAISEIRELTSTARERAKELEANPHIVPIPNRGTDDTINIAELSKLLGLGKHSIYLKVNRGELIYHKYQPRRKMFKGSDLKKYASESTSPKADGTYDPSLIDDNREYTATEASKLIGRHAVTIREKVPCRIRPSKATFKISDIQTYLLSQRGHLWTVSLQNGEKQLLSETLLIAPANYFNQTCLPNWLLTHSVTPSQFLSYIREHGRRTKSLFRKYNLQEKDGSLIHITPHQFRHWINYIADRGGMSADILTLWMGREDPKQTVYYRHATIEEKTEWIKQSIEAKVSTSLIADIFNELPESEKDDFFNGQVQAVHTTPFGLCTHSFAVKPCESHLNCLNGCEYYHPPAPGSHEMANLITLQQVEQVALEAALAHRENNPNDLSELWVEAHKTKLKNIEAAINGTQIDPTPNNFVPLSTLL